LSKKINLSQHLHFNVELGASAVNAETKTVSFVLSDETIVGRGWFDMKLLHGEKNVNLERGQILKVFYNHDSKALPIGKWENLRVEGKKLKGDAVFDKEDEFAMKIFGKLKGGFLESISVGVSLDKYDVKQRDKQNDLVIVKKWGIFEASVVNIPAIPNAKIGFEFEEKINKEQENMTLEEFKKNYPDLYTEVFDLGASQESKRVEAIDKILKPELAHHFTELKYDGKSTATDIELAQYRKIDELKIEDTEKLKLHKKKIDSDGVNLGLQVLDMGLDGDATDDKDAKKIAAEKLEDEEDENAFFSGSGVRRNG
jgi:HK97 family phage prohead protease